MLLHLFDEMWPQQVCIMHICRLTNRCIVRVAEKEPSWQVSNFITDGADINIGFVLNRITNHLSKKIHTKK